MMARQPKYDYETIRFEYLTSEISLNQLAEKNEITKSALVQYARRHGWDDARDKYRTLQDEKSIEAFASKRARKVAEMESDAFEVIHAAIIKMGIDMEDRFVTDPETGERVFIAGMKITPDSLTRLLDKYLVMTGNVTDRRASLGLNINAGGPGEASGIPREVLRELRELAVSKGAGEGSMGQSPIPRLAGAKPVN